MKDKPELIRISASDPTLVSQLADEYRKWASTQKAEAVKYCVECTKLSMAEYKHCLVHLHTH